MIPGKTYTSDDFLRIAWRRKWLIVIPFVLVSVGTFLVVKRLPNRYKSQTTILVVPQRIAERLVASTITASIEDRLRSISDQILSRTRLERIIHDFNLYVEERSKRPLEDVIERMRSNDIKVETMKGGTTFVLSYTTGDAHVAKGVTERLASMFIEENVRDRVVIADGTSQFLESQLDDARQRLIDHERKLEAYRERHAGELPSQLQSNLTGVHNGETQLQTLNESINRDRDRKILQERLLADLQAADIGSPTVAAPAAGVSTAEKLEAARAALTELQTRLKPEHPDVARAKRTIQELERTLTAEAAQRRASNDVPIARLTPAETAQRNRIREIQREIENLDQQIADKQARIREVSENIATFQRRIAAVPTHESAMTELMRDYDTLQKSYTSLLTRREESKTAADLERRQIGEQFKILDPAREPEKPVSPNRPLLVVLGAVVGLMLGLGLTALLEYLDSSLKTEDDVVQALMLPVLALIPYMATESDARRMQKRRTLVMSCIAAAVLLMISAAAAWTLDALTWIR